MNSVPTKRASSRSGTGTSSTKHSSSTVHHGSLGNGHPSIIIRKNTNA
jgi:hypothetical protein